jgi:hypothetical protein
MSLSDLTRNAHLWLPGYLKWRSSKPAERPKRVWLSVADHYEPLWQKPSDAIAQARVDTWRTRWPEIARRNLDSAGRPARYTFFYPEEEYRPALLNPLAEMSAQGIADVEIHIHHDGEGERDFLDRMSGFRDNLRRCHGLLHESGGRTVFGFIHGNWALDNSRPDGRWCGLNNELTLLRDLGCYADFTLPSVPDPAQAGLINTIYWATDDPARPRSHETGVPVVPGGSGGGKASGDLLLIPGPLHLNWHGRSWWKPRIETGELAWNDRVRPERFALWLEAAPRIGYDAFVKLFTHGAQERNSECLLGGGDLDLLYRGMKQECERQGIEIHFASAWEMYQAVNTAARA